MRKSARAVRSAIIPLNRSAYPWPAPDNIEQAVANASRFFGP